MPSAGITAFFAVDSHQTSFEFGRIGAQQLGPNDPEFDRLEALDFSLTVDDHGHSHGLHATCRQTGRDLFPQQRAEFVAHKAVQDSSGQLRFVAQRIQLNRVGQGLQNAVLRDFVEQHSVHDGHGLVLLAPTLNLLCHVPRDGLALAVRVRAEIHVINTFGRFLYILNYFCLAFDYFIAGLKFLFDVHTDGVGGQVLDVSDGGLDDKILAKVLRESFCFRR